MDRIRKPNQEWLDRYGDGHEEYLFKCPGGCGEHRVIVKWGSKATHDGTTPKTEPKWTFNGSMERPTFAPSLLVRWTFTEEEHGFTEKHVCHSFIRDGRIQFLGDCTHDKKGLTVPLADVEEGS